MNFRFGIVFLLLAFGMPPAAFAQGLRGTGEVIPAYVPEDLAALERLEFEIRPDGFDPDLVHQAAETPLMKKALIELTTHVLLHFPPSEFDYVSLGRSPSVLSIAMKELLRMRASGAQVIELPISGLRHDQFEATWYRQTLKAHFQKYFYRGESPTGRKVLILDFVQKGGTLNSFADILELGKAEGWITREVHILGLLNPKVDPRELWLATYSRTRGKFPQAQWHTMYLPKVIWPYFYYSSFKHLAQYEGWEFRNHEYEEGVKWASATRPGMPGSNRRRNGATIPEPKVSSPKSNERQALPSLLRFWLPAITERSEYAEDLQALIRPEQVFAAAIKGCHRVHRAD